MSDMNYLLCQYDERDSFSQKAVYEEVGNEVRLYSYNLLVCVIKDGIPELKNTERHSGTTRRHVREFVKQFAYDKIKDVNAFYKTETVCKY